MKKLLSFSALLFTIFVAVSFTSCQKGGDAEAVAKILNDSAEKIDAEPAEFKTIKGECDKQLEQYVNSTEELTEETRADIIDAFLNAAVAGSKAVYGNAAVEAAGSEFVSELKMAYNKYLGNAQTVGEIIHEMNNLPKE